jgi:hypothetical protein
MTGKPTKHRKPRQPKWKQQLKQPYRSTDSRQLDLLDYIYECKKREGFAKLDAAIDAAMAKVEGRP